MNWMDKIGIVSIGVIDFGDEFSRNVRYQYKVVTYDGDNQMEIVPGIFANKREAEISKKLIIKRVTSLGKKCVAGDDIEIKDRCIYGARKDLGQLELKAMKRRRGRSSNRLYRP